MAAHSASPSQGASGRRPSRPHQMITRRVHSRTAARAKPTIPDVTPASRGRKCGASSDPFSPAYFSAKLVRPMPNAGWLIATRPPACSRRTGRRHSPSRPGHRGRRRRAWRGRSRPRWRRWPPPPRRHRARTAAPGATRRDASRTPPPPALPAPVRRPALGAVDHHRHRADGDRAPRRHGPVEGGLPASGDEVAGDDQAEGEVPRDRHRGGGQPGVPLDRGEALLQGRESSTTSPRPRRSGALPP